MASPHIQYGVPHIQYGVSHIQLSYSRSNSKKPEFPRHVSTSFRHYSTEVFLAGMSISTSGVSLNRNSKIGAGISLTVA
jgi:hypothetical protein